MDAIGLSELIHWAYTIGPISALISPFLLGRLADRFFATEKVLGVLNILGSFAMVAASMVDGSSGGGHEGAGRILRLGHTADRQRPP